MKTWHWILIVVVALAGGAFAGMKYQKSADIKDGYKPTK